MVHLNNLQRDRSGVLQPVFVLTQLVKNSLKIVWEYENPPALPLGSSIPAEDIDVVRAALISHPKFITADRELREAINSCEALHLTAIHPAEALILAQDS
jgi:hypothetical protein